MMIEAKYSEAAVEVLDILNYTDKEDVKKIPQSFINFLTEIANKNYKANFNHNGPISGLNLRKQTRELLGFIYITWWCNEKDRNKFKSIIHSDNSKVVKTEKNENYNIDDIFKNKKELKSNVVTQNVVTEEISMIEYKEENIFKKIINKILSFFTNKRERS
jgi:hypothetical protein